FRYHEFSDEIQRYSRKEIGESVDRLVQSHGPTPSLLRRGKLKDDKDKGSKERSKTVHPPKRSFKQTHKSFVPVNSGRADGSSQMEGVGKHGKPPDSYC
ncbi:hypothetical protein LINPERPRIM_LOCUS31271, partial [Linum perenne]